MRKYALSLTLLTLKKYYSVDKLKEYAHKLSTVYQKVLRDVLSPDMQPSSDMILKSIQKLTTI